MKIRSYGDEVTAFNDKEMSEVCSSDTCLAIITINSALKKDENYYPKVLLKECKYTEREKKSLNILLLKT